MAKIIFNALWKSQKKAIEITCQTIEAYSVSERKDRYGLQLIKQLQQQLKQLQKQRTGLRKMRALEEISGKEFLQNYEKLNAKITSL